MKYEIAIRVDTNDADYMTELNDIDSDQLQIIKPLIEAIKNFQPYSTRHKDSLGDYSWTHTHNYPFGDCLREDLGQKSAREYYGFPEEVHEFFEELCGYPEHGFHTVESITLTPWVEKEELL